jgi:septal ring-binding cell division protein DamX
VLIYHTDVDFTSRWDIEWYVVVSEPYASRKLSKLQKNLRKAISKYDQQPMPPWPMSLERMKVESLVR